MSAPPAKLVQIMAGARQGGAELFFERLALGFAERQIDQTALIRPWPERMARLKAAGIEVRGQSFARPLAPLIAGRLAASWQGSDRIMCCPG